MAVGQSRKGDERVGSVAPGRENSTCGVEVKAAEQSLTKGVKINIARHCAFWSFLSFLWPFPETPLSSTMTLRAPWNPEQNKELLSDQLSYNERMTPRFLIYAASSELAFVRAALCYCLTVSHAFYNNSTCLSCILFLLNFPFSFLFKSLASLLSFYLSLSLKWNMSRRCGFRGNLPSRGSFSNETQVKLRFEVES